MERGKKIKKKNKKKEDFYTSENIFQGKPNLKIAWGKTSLHAFATI